jgi:hypothetical protein
MNKLVILSKLKKNKINIKSKKNKLYCSNKNNILLPGVNCKKDVIINKYNTFYINVHPDHIDKHHYYTLKTFDNSKYCIDKKNMVTSKTHIECTSSNYNENSKFQLYFDPYNVNKYAIRGGINNRWCNISNNGYLKCDFDAPEYYEIDFEDDDKFIKQDDGTICNHRFECKSNVCLVNCCLTNKDNVGCNLCGIDGSCQSCKENFTWDEINQKCLSNVTLKKDDIININNKLEEDCIDEGYKSCKEKEKIISTTTRENQKILFEKSDKIKEQKCIESGFLNCKEKNKFINFEKLKLEENERINMENKIMESNAIKKAMDLKNKIKNKKSLPKYYSSNSKNLQNNYNRIKIKKLISYLIYILVILVLIFFIINIITPLIKR